MNSSRRLEILIFVGTVKNIHESFLQLAQRVYFIKCRFK